MSEQIQETLPITAKGKEQLNEELKKLLSEDRPAVVKAIEEARDHGDLKENAEYHAAKERQGFIEARIKHLKAVIASAQVIDPAELNYEHIVFGATVELVDIDSEEEKTYQIVGEDEADIAKGKISINSPLARALIGKHEGDEVDVRTPKGKTSYEVGKIQYK